MHVIKHILACLEDGCGSVVKTLKTRGDVRGGEIYVSIRAPEKAYACGNSGASLPEL